MDRDNIKGLTHKEVKESRESHGENIITPSDKVSAWRLYLEKFEDPMIRILLFALLLSTIIGFIHNDFTEVIGVAVAVMLATTIGFWFEWDAARKFDILNVIGDEVMVRVIRDGKVTEVLKKDIVVGDIVLLETGDEIPADGIIIESVSLSVDESSLTGEPETSKSADISEITSEATYPANMLLRGCMVLEGSAVMQVTTVGDATEFGKVARLATKQSEEKTPLTLQLDGLARLISVIGSLFALSLFVILYVKGAIINGDYPSTQRLMLLGLLISLILMLGRVWLSVIADGVALARKREKTDKLLPRLGWAFWIAISIVFFMAFAYIIGCEWWILSSWISLDVANSILSYFMIAVTLIVVAVPEGLPMSVTLSLALNMRRMLKTNNLVRKMHASETMGAITVICTDKTGTLTQNRMQVSHADFYIAKDSTDKLASDVESMVVAEALSINSTAHLERSEWGVKSIGNPTEASLLLWLDKMGVDYSLIREEADILDKITFSTKNKYMATMVNSKYLGAKVVYIKGAPEVIINKCSMINQCGELKPLNTYIDKVEGYLLEQQQRAQRTLAFAYKIVDGDKDCADTIEESGFTLMGVVAISDPVRPDVKAAIEEVHSAGISVKVVTGDTTATATEIARQIGLWDTEKDSDNNRITGTEFEALSDEEAFARVRDLKIISRARPADKQRLVEMLQRHGEVVAVTGDGTNDAPALNAAHVGLSMGTGTAVAKEASDITLIDDSFTSISTAVMWGRSLYKNIQRFLFFQLTINVIALVIVLIGSIIGREVPLTITQMLWVNLIMDTLAAAALASLPPSKSVMRDKPRKKSDFILTPTVYTSILFMAAIQLIMLMFLHEYIERNYVGEDYVYGMTIFFTTFVMFQFWNIFNANGFLTNNTKKLFTISINSSFIVVAILILVGQIIIVTFGGEMFRVVPLEIMDWVKIIGCTAIMLPIGGLMRLIKVKNES